MSNDSVPQGDDAAEAREADRAWAKRDHAAYAKGQDAGKKVGLDTQVSAASKARQLKE